MKFDLSRSPRLAAGALAILLPLGAAQATDLYDSLKSLTAPPPPEARQPAEYPASTGQPVPSGAQGPIRSDTATDQPATAPSDQPVTDQSGQPVVTDPAKRSAGERSP
ncbi:MAG: hypothetical protein H6R10_3561 [Rhodocyclaceae bacterium]|nr:hypothetical protein [Rhodocyclaceae bacterium]